MSQLGQQTITVHILPNISQSKDNQTLKFNQKQNIKIEIFFFKNIYNKYLYKYIYIYSANKPSPPNTSPWNFRVN